MDLFDHAAEKIRRKNAPLAARMRPRTLDEYVGQDQIIGPGRLLRRAIEADQLSSLIFYGPPGTGKTTLAQVIAGATRAHFDALNAVLAGVADIRRAVAEAEQRLGQHGRPTILFVDEVHRFNKSQQDALLPHVEFGTVILIGATTENPYFEVNKTILSRSRIFELSPLQPAHLKTIMTHALEDTERGFGKKQVSIDSEALEHLADVAGGDARTALNALELAVETTEPDPKGTIHISRKVAEESIQRRAVLYDKEGDAHYDTISAFIKSIRGSDPDAALYWMARMVYAGEDPRFIFRRMIISAAEDIGMADPNALGVVTRAAQAFDYVGLPEGRFHLAEACLYLATAPKSNSTLAFFDALAAVEKEQAGEVPNHLKDASRDAKGLGHGEGYLYPHAYRDHWVAQQYLPQALQGRMFYQPSETGFEGTLAEQVRRFREAQLAAERETREDLGGYFPTGEEEEPTLKGKAGKPTPGEMQKEGWHQRTQGNLSQHLENLRHRLMELAALHRQHLVLDANAGTGLMTWDALRKTPEGGVWARVDNAADATALFEQARNLPALSAPVILEAQPENLKKAIAEKETKDSTQSKPASVKFDRIIARGLLGRAANKKERLNILADLLASEGELIIAEPLPTKGERILANLDWSGVPPKLKEKTLAAEESLYTNKNDPQVNWDENTLIKLLKEAGLHIITKEHLPGQITFHLSQNLLNRWFDEQHGKLAKLLGPDASTVKKHLQTQSKKPIQRKTTVAIIQAAKTGEK